MSPNGGERRREGEREGEQRVCVPQRGREERESEDREHRANGNVASTYASSPLTYAVVVDL